MDASSSSEERESKPDLMDRKPNNLKLGFMYASGERNSKPDPMDRIVPNNPKLGFLHASEEHNSKAGPMDRIVLPPDLTCLMKAAAKSRRASKVGYYGDEDEDGSYWYKKLQKEMEVPVGFGGRGRSCVETSLSEFERERAAAERRWWSRKKSADKHGLISAQCFVQF